MALQQAGLQWVNQGLGGFIGGISQGNRAMQDVGDGAEGASNKFNLLNGVVMGVASSITTFLIDAFTKVGKAMVGVVTDSVGMAQSFESMATRLKIAGTGAATAAGIALEDLSEAALKVGGDTRLMGVSATGAADAITDLLKAGLSVDDVMGDFNAYMQEGAELGGVLGGAIRLAAASELDMVSASNLASTSMTIFGISAGDITSAMDYIVRGADASVASVSDIRDALEGAGPTLRGFGFSLEDSVDALSLLSNAGIKGAEAGTALRSAFTQMASNKDKVINALAEQGVAITDAEGNFLSFKEIITQLEIATGSMTEAARADFLQTIAGAYGKTALTALINQGTEAYDKYAVSVQNAAGIQQQSEANAKTAAAAQEALQGNIETLRIRLGSVFLPVWTQVMKGVSQGVEMVLPALTPVLETAGEMFLKVADSMSLFLELVGAGEEPLKVLDYVLMKALGREATDKIMGTIDAVINGINTVKSTIEGFIGILTTSADEGGALLDYVQLLPDSLQNVGLVMGDVIVAISGFVQEAIPKLITAFTNVKEWVGTNWPIIRDTVIEVFGRVMEIFESVKGWVETNWPIIAAVVLTAFETIKRIVVTVVDSIKPAIQSLIKAFGGIDIENLTYGFETFKKIVGGVALFIGSMFVAALGVVTGVVDALVGLIEGIVEIWNDMMTNIRDWVESLSKGDFKKAFKAFGKLFVDAFEAPFKLVWKIIEGFVTGVYDFFKNLSKQLVGKSIIPDMMNAIFDVFDKVLTNIINFVKKWLNDMLQLWEDFAKALERAWEILWDTIESMVNTALDSIVKIITSFLDAIVKIWDAFKSTLEKIWKDLWDAIESAVKTAWNAIVAAVSAGLQNIINTITSYAQTLIQKGRDIVENIKNGIVEAWVWLIETVRAKIEEIVSAVWEKAEALWEAGKEIVENIKKGLTEWWSGENGIVAAIGTKLKNLKTDLTTAWVWVMDVGGEIITKIKKGLTETWYKIKDWLGDMFGGTGIDSLWDIIVKAAAAIKDAGGRIVGYIMEGIERAWEAFKAWLISKIIGIIDEILGRGTTSSAETLLPGTSGVNALPVMGGGYLRDVNNSRSVVIQIDANYANSQSEAGIYYDVVAALAGARI